MPTPSCSSCRRPNPDPNPDPDPNPNAGLLRVCSTFAPDEDDGRRFNFAFKSCDVRWRSVSLPLPPVGKGWGEVVYLDDDFRIQRDVRGDLLVATRLE